MGMMDDPEELPLISSSPELATQPEQPKFQDELDMPALKRVLVLLETQIAACNDNSSIDISESNFKVKQQLALNRQLAAKLSEVHVLVETTISEVKEQYE
jgi:hypothetical protein